MLTSKILGKKNTMLDKLGQTITDLIHSTFVFPESSRNSSIAIVGEYEDMRPDLVSNRIYGEQSKWDAMLKYNGISNPFSIQKGDVLYTLPHSSLNSVYSAPRVIEERKQKNESDVSLIGGTSKDKNRVMNLVKKSEGGLLPPNLNKPGDKNVKVKDGKLVFGEDVTTVNKDNCPVPISRARLQKALLKDKLF